MIRGFHFNKKNASLFLAIIFFFIVFYLYSLIINNLTLVKTSKRIEATSSYIYNGTPVQKNEFPYYVLFRTSMGKECGGTLLNEEYVLTAAHCLINIKSRGIITYFVGADEWIEKNGVIIPKNLAHGSGVVVQDINYGLNNIFIHDTYILS